jgi:undecaprenyl diphosphate synthase
MARAPERPDFGGPFPAHIAVIMDGNGRWAQKQGFKRVFGHEKGVAAVRTIVTECAQLGVESLTLYAFSVENWKRPEHEIRFLMGMLERFLVDERPTLMENRVRLRGLGRVEDLPAAPLRELRAAEAQTAANDGMLLRLALSYGSRSEIADALKRYGADVQAGRVDPSRADEETLRAYLYDSTTPDPDLLIRTAGELRLSNFLLWQSSYTELHVVEACWPEFGREELHAALRAYAVRTRKYGGLAPDKQARNESDAQGGLASDTRSGLASDIRSGLASDSTPPRDPASAKGTR